MRKAGALSEEKLNCVQGVCSSRGLITLRVLTCGLGYIVSNGCAHVEPKMAESRKRGPTYGAVEHVLSLIPAFLNVPLQCGGVEWL